MADQLVCTVSPPYGVTPDDLPYLGAGAPNGESRMITDPTEPTRVVLSPSVRVQLAEPDLCAILTAILAAGWLAGDTPIESVNFEKFAEFAQEIISHANRKP